MKTKNLYEVTQEGATLHLVWCGGEDHEAMPPATVELSYHGTRPASVDGVVVDSVRGTFIGTPAFNLAYDAAQSFLDSPECDYDAIGEAWALVFTNSYSRDVAR